MAIDITGKAAGAIAAYANTAKIADGIPSEERVGNVKNNVSFGDLVREGIEGAIESQKKSEQVSAQALVGQADITDVISALNEAETALQMVVAVRDKVLTAYQEIMRMPI